MTAEVEAAIEQVLQDYAAARKFLTLESLTVHLREMGFNRARSTVQIYMAAMNVKTRSLYLKPTLNPKQRLARLDFVIMKDRGSNDFKVPHNGVRKNQKKDTLENFLICDREVYKVAQIEAERLRNL